MDTRNKEKTITDKKNDGTKNIPQSNFIEGWKGCLPTKPYYSFPLAQQINKLNDDPNVEYHDHGPRDKCDSFCRKS